MNESKYEKWFGIGGGVVVGMALIYAIMGPRDIAVPDAANHFISGFVGLAVLGTALSYSILTVAMVMVLLLVIYTEVTAVRKDVEFAMIALLPTVLMGGIMLLHAWYSGVFLGPCLGAALGVGAMILLLQNGKSAKSATN